MIAYADAMRLGGWFLFAVFPLILLFAFIWRSRARRLNLVTIVQAVLATLAGQFFGTVLLFPFLLGLSFSSELALAPVLAVPSLGPALAAYLLLLHYRRPRQRAGFYAAGMFLLPYTGVLLLLAYMHFHPAPYLVG